MGFEKMVSTMDAKEAAAQGLYQRPLTTSQVEKHLQDLGIEPEFGTHSRMRGLSGASPLIILSEIGGLLIAIEREADCVTGH